MDKTIRLKYVDIYEHFSNMILSGVMQSGDKLPTEEQVARQFEVSRITVIRALKQLESDGYIRRVQGSGSYVQNRINRSNDLKIVSLIMPFKGQGREIQLIQSIEMRLKQAGYLLSVSNSEQSIEVEKELVLNMKNKVQGIIIYSVTSIDNNQLFESMMKEQWPVVYIDRYPMNVPCSYVTCDNYEGGYRIGRYFLEEGHTQIALIYHDIVRLTSERDRFNGFMKAMSEGNIPRSNIRIISIDPVGREETIGGIMRELYMNESNNIRHPTAIFTINDTLALILMDYIRGSMRYSLPEGFVIAGFDDLKDTQYDLPFVTIHQNYHSAGEKAAELLIAKMETNSLVNEQITIPVELVKYKI